LRLELKLEGRACIANARFATKTMSRNSCARSRRRRRGADPSIAARCYAAVVVIICICGHRDDDAGAGMACLLPGVESFRHDERRSTSPCSRIAAVSARGGGGGADSDDESDVQITSRLASSKTGESARAAHGERGAERRAAEEHRFDRGRRRRRKKRRRCSGRRR